MILGTPINEEKWARAKKRAAEQGQAENYALITHIYKEMMYLSGSKKKKVKKTAKSVVSVGDSQYYNDKKVSLSLMKGELQEFRCENCDALLLRGRNLRKSHIEIKCRKCGKIVVNL